MFSLELTFAQLFWIGFGVGFVAPLVLGLAFAIIYSVRQGTKK